MWLRACSLFAGVCLLSVTAVHTQSPPAASAPGITGSVYKELRNLSIGSDAYQVDSLVLDKDAASFTLTGILYMLPPVQGKETGAVFVGQGAMAYSPPLAVERGSLRLLTRED